IIAARIVRQVPGYQNTYCNTRNSCHQRKHFDILLAQARMKSDCTHSLPTGVSDNDRRNRITDLQPGSIILTHSLYPYSVMSLGIGPEFIVAGEEGLEPPTCGFGIRRSTLGATRLSEQKRWPDSATT